MRYFLFILFIALTGCSSRQPKEQPAKIDTLTSQIEPDSIVAETSAIENTIRLRKTDSLDGKIKTWYTPGNKAIAEHFQSLLIAAAGYYEKNYSASFEIKLAVLDSAQWLHESSPYGFIFYEDGWIVMNTGMNYESFKRIYGLESFAGKFDKILTADKISPQEMIQAIFDVYCIHELGHYFFDEQERVLIAGKWPSELLASYFSYEFFMNNDAGPLLELVVFSMAYRDYFKPLYTTLNDFDLIYMRMGVENYLWYQCNFYLLATKLYGCNQTEFIPFLEKKFSYSREWGPGTEEAIAILENGCTGEVKSWVKKMENTPHRKK